MRHLRLLLLVALGLLGLVPTVMADEVEARQAFYLGPVNVNYSSFRFKHKVNDRWSVSLNATLARKSTYTNGGTVINMGGNDAEVLATYELAEGSALDPELSVGVSKPDTFERRDYQATVRFSVRLFQSEDVKVHAGVRGVVTGKAIVMPYADVTYGKKSSVRFEGWLGAPVIGDNTVDADTGWGARGVVYLAGVSFPIDQEGNSRLGLYVTNQLGTTTGMSVSPSIGKRAGFGLAFSARF
jgi:hypothetical protein